MHPMLQLTIRSGIIAFLITFILPAMPWKWRKVALVSCIFVFFYLTLWRGSRSGRQINLLPFWSYRKWSAADVRWQIYMNIFLFIPYGAILKSLRVRYPALIALLTSMLIELMQFAFARGLCEIDDVINNTMGAAIGCSLFAISDIVFRKVKAGWKSR